MGLECGVAVVVLAGTQRMMTLGTRSMVGPVGLHGACCLVARQALAPWKVVLALLSERATVLAHEGIAATLEAGSLAKPWRHDHKSSFHWLYAVAANEGSFSFEESSVVALFGMLTGGSTSGGQFDIGECSV